MKNKIIKTISLVIVIFAISFYGVFAASRSDSVNVNLQVNNCNNDTVCDISEDYASCPSDCSPVCNNNSICEPGWGEDITTCPLDCTPPPVCNNNNICEPPEDILNCPGDCVILPPVCNNNNICEIGENITNCPLDCTPPTPEPTTNITTGSFLYGNFFNNLKIEPSYNSVLITWGSSFPTASSLKWGTSEDYKDGVIKNIDLVLNHRINILNLKEGTTYYFRIESTDYLGRTNVLSNQFFTTLSFKDITPPGNPTNIKASSEPYGITVSWKNPDDEDFDYIRVMRNTNRYYGSPYSGNLIYEGRGSYFTDTKVKNGQRYFYSLFSRDKNKNYSSGALISLIYNLEGNVIVGGEKEPPIIGGGEIIIPPTVSGIKYFITQDSSYYDFNLGNTIALSGDSEINIKTNYPAGSLTDDFWVQINNKDGDIVGQYFLSRNRDKDGYMTANIPSFDLGGYYGVSIYKYSNSFTRIINQGGFEIGKVGVVTDSIPSKDYTLYYFIFIVFILIPILWLFLIFHKKSKDKKQKL